MIDNEYFVEGATRVLGEETILEPNGDEAVVFDEQFTAGLRMPLHRPLEYTVEIVGAIPSAYPQCHWAALVIYLGGG
jgi:hypothetical protein